jgi:thymidine kinase
MCGKNGSGKTKRLIDSANNFASQDLGQVVYLDSTNQLIFSLDHRIRFINVSDFPISKASEFIGFISGIISKDYDIKIIVIDSLESIIADCQSEITRTLQSLQKLSEKFNVDFQIGFNGEVEETDLLKKEFVA